MNIKKISLYAAIVLVVAGGISLLGFHGQPQQSVGQSVNYIKAFTVSTGVTVATTSTKVLDASSGRVYATFVNDGTVPIYLTCGKTAVAHTGIRLNDGGGAYEINALNQCVGEMDAITASSTAVLTVTAVQ